MTLIYKTLSLLPFALLQRLADLAYPIVYYLARYRRDTVAQNLALAFPDKTPADRLAIEKAFYRNLCNIAFEAIKSLHLKREVLRERVKLTNTACFEGYLEQGQSILVLSAHKGNWEWGQLRLADSLPCPQFGIYKPLHDQAIDQLMLQTRSHFDSKMIAFKDAAREILRRRHECNAYVMMADQAPARSDKRYWRTFFHRPAPFYFGPQRIAESLQLPVIYADICRTRRGYYEIHFELLAAPPHTKGGTEILDRYVDRMTTAIATEPAAWLWSHRRWKTPTPSEIASGALPPVDVTPSARPANGGS